MKEPGFELRSTLFPGPLAASRVEGKAQGKASALRLLSGPSKAQLAPGGLPPWWVWALTVPALRLAAAPTRRQMREEGTLLPAPPPPRAWLGSFSPIPHVFILGTKARRAHPHFLAVLII